MRSSGVVLYRFFGPQKELLYIGITKDFPKRLKQHRATKEWIELVYNISFEDYPHEGQAAAAEEIAIKKEKPLFNKRHSEFYTIYRIMAVGLDRKTADYIDRIEDRGKSKTEFICEAVEFYIGNGYGFKIPLDVNGK